jgi:integrase
MRLNQKNADALELPEGRTDYVQWDDELPGFGLRLRAGEDGKTRRSWCVQYRFKRRSRRMTIGTKLTAEQARTKARQELARVELGEDPAGDKQKERDNAARTFRSIVADYLPMKEETLRPASYRVMKIYLTGVHFKALHSRGIAEIGRADIAQCLNGIRGRPTRSRARAHLSAFFTWCLKQGFVEINPVVATEDAGQGPPRDRVLSDADIAAIWNACADDDFGKIVRLLTLLPCRRQEIGGLRWSEIDRDKGTITLPKERTKNNHAHTLPLLPMAQTIIDSVPQVVGRDYLFGVFGDGYTGWSDGKAKLDDRLGNTVGAFVLHDLRRSVATWLAEHGDVEPHIIEAILNHYSGHRSGVAGVYNRARYARHIKTALAKWEDHLRSLLDGTGRKVLNFQQPRGIA